MRTIGVLDVRNGVAVHAIAGQREAYRPVVSVLCSGSGPLALARAMHEHLGLEELYLADLDAILGGERNQRLYEELAGLGLRLMVDCGVRTSGPAGPWRLVGGLETLEGPEHLSPELVFSLDLKGGQPLAGSNWPASPRDILREVVQRGVRSVIVLDLARVGTGQGAGTEALCAWVKEQWPGVELIAGGGVQGMGDLQRLQAVGVDAVLVASALHDGRLQRDDLRRL